MGYNTQFEGEFTVTPALKDEHREYLERFADTCHVRRDEQRDGKIYDPARKAAGLPFGPQGAYFVGRDRSHRLGIGIDERPPQGQPGYWCQWTPTEDGEGIAWNGGEKFHDYVEWINYLIEQFLKPWGYTLDGNVLWRGEDFHDEGLISVRANKVESRRR